MARWAWQGKVSFSREQVAPHPLHGAFLGGFAGALPPPGMALISLTLSSELPNQM